jgi:VCBS repeat-containing protein
MKNSITALYLTGIILLTITCNKQNNVPGNNLSLNENMQKIVPGNGEIHLDGGSEYSITVSHVAEESVGALAEFNINAYHEEGISEIKIGSENISDYIDCNNQTTCTTPYYWTFDYEGEQKIIFYLKKASGSITASVERIVDFTCPDEYCEPEPLINDFFQWMRKKGYAECITSQYFHWVMDGRFKKTIKENLDKAPSNITQPYSVKFYDIIGTDIEATNVPMGEGEGENCTYDDYFTDYCPNPVNVDYHFIENQYRNTFGIDFQFEYHRIEVDYSESIGEPIVLSASGNYKFNQNPSFMNQFESGSVIHFAVNSWNGVPAISEIGSGTGHAPLSGASAAYYHIAVNCHEWGHTRGFQHPFWKDENGTRHDFSIKAVMDYKFYSDFFILNPPDPVERYALEPLDGYIDESDFVSNYYYGVVGSDDFPVCGSVDPAIESLNLISEDSDTIAFSLALNNYGDIPLGYVTLTAYNYYSEPVEERIIRHLPSQETVTNTFTVLKSDFPYQKITFKLDGENVIVENSEENNTASYQPDEIEVDTEYGYYIVEDITTYSPPWGDYTFRLNSPTAGEVILHRNNIPVYTLQYNWQTTVHASDPSMFYTFDFPGFFSITIRKGGTGTINLYRMNSSIFDGNHHLLFPLEQIIENGTYGNFNVVSILDNGAPAGTYTFHVNSPTEGMVELLRNGVHTLNLSYNWLATVKNNNPTYYYTFDFPGYFSITVENATGGSRNLYSIDQSIFNGNMMIKIE